MVMVITVRVRSGDVRGGKCPTFGQSRCWTMSDGEREFNGLDKAAGDASSPGPRRGPASWRCGRRDANNASSAGAAGEWRAGGSIHSLIRRRLWPPAK